MKGEEKLDRGATGVTDRRNISSQSKNNGDLDGGLSVAIGYKATIYTEASRNNFGYLGTIWLTIIIHTEGDTIMIYNRIAVQLL